MSLSLIIAACVIVFVFTTVLTMAGLGAAFIVIPAFYWLGVPLKEAMAIALRLNGISMISPASPTLSTSSSFTG